MQNMEIRDEDYQLVPVENEPPPAVLVLIYGEGNIEVYRQGTVRVHIRSCGRGVNTQNKRWWKRWLSHFWFNVMLNGDRQSEMVDERTIEERLDSAMQWAVPEIISLVCDKVNGDRGPHQ